MKKLFYLIVLTLILGLVLTGCLLSNVGQVPTSEQSGITYLTKGGIPPSVDLVGLWHFDEGTGITANDSSGSGNTGTLVNDPLWEVLGKFGNALSFDGMDDYVDCEKNVDITTAITVEAWINPSEFTDYDAIVTNFEWRNVSKQQGWSFRVMADGKLVWRAVLSGNDRYFITSKSAMEANNWYHVVLTHDTNYTRLYINGSKDKEETPGGTIVNLGKALKIGWDDWAAERVFNGTIDEVRIWDGALTGSNIEYNYSLRNIGIDIKPGSDPNSINLGSNGVVPVAILGSEDFEAATVNPSTVTLAGADVKLKGKSGNAGSLEDVNDDGYLDLVVQVYTTSLVLTSGDAEAVLNAYTYAGPALTGSDSIRIVPPE